jgi:hypothetical protein
MQTPEMASIEAFKKHIDFERTFLSDEQCKSLYASVVISSDWQSIFQGVDATNLPVRLENKISSFLDEKSRYGTEHKATISELIQAASFQPMDIEACKKYCCSKSQTLNDFIGKLELYCSQTVPTLTGEDVSKMYLCLAVGGPDMFAKNSQKLRYKERKAMVQYYSTNPIEQDNTAISTVLSLVKH